MSELRAILVTDVVDSTAIAERLGHAAASALWSVTDRIVRDLLRAWNGREIDKSDGWLLLFVDATDAMACADAMHRTLGRLAHPVAIRVGLHVGPVTLRIASPDDVALGAKPLEVDGATKAIAARVMAIGRGGQTLLTADAKQALGPSASGLQPRGHWRLKGIVEPIELFEAVADESTAAPPADSEKAHRVLRHGDEWIPVARIPNNLPHGVSSFVGRRREIDQARDLFARSRLLSLCGTGGMGKSRLSLRLAHELMHEHPDGVWWVELAPLVDGSQVIPTIAATMDVKEEPGIALIDSLRRVVRAQSMLIVLDNCEHLLTACASAVTSLLAAGGQVKVLVTSRERLHVDGEAVFVVPALQTPEPHQAGMLAALMACDATRLFIERASGLRSRMSSADADPAAIAEICRCVDGIPLAIELAAARVASMSLPMIIDRLSDRFRLLTRGSRASLPRGQTLRATIDWSWNLLSPPEQALLARLAVFAGGFTLTAAEAVCGGDGANDITELLASLVDKSLVGFDPRSERYGLLETIRHYAQDRLRAAGGEAFWQQQHRAFYLALVLQGQSPHQEVDGRDTVQRLQVEHDNLHAALAACQEAPAEHGLRLAEALWRYWDARGLYAQGRKWLETFIARPGAQNAGTGLARALTAASTLAIRQGDAASAREHATRALDLLRATGEAAATAEALSRLGACAMFEGSLAEAQVLLEESLTLFRGLGDAAGIARVLTSIGSAAYRQTDLARARRHYDEALDIHRRLGNEAGAAYVHSGLGLVACDAGDYGAAHRHLGMSLAIASRVGVRTLEAAALNNQGLVHERQGELQLARSLYERSLAVWREVGAKREIAQALNNLAALSCEAGRHAEARHMHEEALKIRQEIGDRHGIAETLANLAASAFAAGEFDLAAGWYRESLVIEQALGNLRGVVVALEGLSEIAATSANTERATRLWAAARELRKAGRLPASPLECRQHEQRLGALAHPAEVAPASKAAVRSARPMTLDQAVRYALAGSAN